MWVRCLGIIHAEKAGSLETYHRGDWCELGKAEARRLLAEGRIEIPELSSPDDQTMLMENCGLVIWEQKEGYEKVVEEYPALDYTLEKHKPELVYYKNIFWDGKSAIDPKLFPLGVSRLDSWQIAVPVLDMVTLAEDLGTEEEREHTKEVIYDLRVPVYDTGIIFARRSYHTEKLFDLWDPHDGNRELGFIRSLYQACPVLLTLPTNWRKDG